MSCRTSLASHSLDLNLAKEPIRAEHEDQYQNGKWGDLFHATTEHRIQVAPGEILKHPDQYASDDGAHDAVQAPEDDHRKHLEPQVSQGKIDTAAYASQNNPTQRRHHRSDAPGEGEHALHADA